MVVGSISYIGLIVPNVVAMFKGDKIRGTLVDTALFGALFVLVCDMIGRVVIAPYELPIELIVGILGSLIFVLLLLYRLSHGRKAIRLGNPGHSSCTAVPCGAGPERRGILNRTAYRSNVKKITVLALFVLLAAVVYMLVEVHFDSTKLFQYAMKIRTPKLIVMLITAFAIGGASMLIVMLITAFAIGGASIVFQSIINNTIVTPCLLGMNSLYTLIHTAVVFCAGSASALASNPNLSFAVDLLLMGVVATLVYSYLFQKTNHNILYVLLIGTVLSSFFPVSKAP